jgi:hypothetical protein
MNSSIRDESVIRAEHSKHALDAHLAVDITTHNNRGLDRDDVAFFHHNLTHFVAESLNRVEMSVAQNKRGYMIDLELILGQILAVLGNLDPLVNRHGHCHDTTTNDFFTQLMEHSKHNDR